MSGRAWVLSAAALWSSGGLLITLARPVDPAAIACLRSAVAALTLAWAIPKIRAALTARALLCGLCYTGIVGAFVAATALTTAAHAVFLQYLYPLLVALASREKKSARTWLAVALGGAGVAVILSQSIGAIDAKGLALGLGSAVAFTAFVLLQRSLPAAHPAGAAALYNMIAALALLPFAFRHLSMPLSSFGLIASMGVVQLGLPYVCFLRGLRTVPAADAAVLTLLEPVLNPIWVFLALGQQPGTWTLAGGGVLLLALFVRLTERTNPT